MLKAGLKKERSASIQLESKTQVLNSKKKSYQVLGSIFVQIDMMIILEIIWGSLHCRKLNASGFTKVFRSIIQLYDHFYPMTTSPT